MGNCCSNEKDATLIDEEEVKAIKKLKFVSSMNMEQPRMRNKKKKLTKSKTMARPKMTRFSQNVQKMNKSIDFSNDHSNPNSSRSSIKNPDFNPFLLNSVHSGMFSNNFNFDHRGTDFEEFDSMISRSYHQKSHKFGGSVLTNFSSNNLLMQIQRKIPYYLLSDCDDEMLKEHPKFDDFEFKIDLEQNTEYFGELGHAGEKHGFGVYKLKNGDLYVGEFENGKMRGKGVYYYGEGDAVKGFFGKFGRSGVKSLIGKGIYRWKDGRKYCGYLDDGKPHGKGKVIFQGYFLTIFF